MLGVLLVSFAFEFPSARLISPGGGASGVALVCPIYDGAAGYQVIMRRRKWHLRPAPFSKNVSLCHSPNFKMALTIELARLSIFLRV